MQSELSSLCLSRFFCELIIFTRNKTTFFRSFIPYFLGIHKRDYEYLVSSRLSTSLFISANVRVGNEVKKGKA